MLLAAERGWARLVDGESPTMLGWLVMGFSNAAAVGISVHLARRYAPFLLLMVQIGMTALIAGLGDIYQFIV